MSLDIQGGNFFNTLPFVLLGMRRETEELLIF
jgi:hypothetical protein